MSEASAAAPEKSYASERRSFLSFSSLWRNTTFLLALSTFASLLITRELDPVTIVLFPSLLLLAWFFDTPPRFWRPWMGWVITAGVILVLARLAYFEYFRTLLRLLLFLVLYKCFTLRTSRDYIQVQILCFFVLVATAVITVTFLFSFVFPVYLFLAVLALVLYSIGRKREEIAPRGTLPAERAAGWQVLGALPPRFLGASVAGSLFVFLLLVLYFYLIPHYSLQKLDAPLAPQRGRPNPTAVSGFGEDVKLGEFKKIQPDATVVMRVELDRQDEEAAPPDHLRLRGVVLDIYENNRWRRNSSARRRVLNTLLKAIDIQKKSVLETERLVQKVYQNPDITLRLFGATYPEEFRFEEQVWGRRDVGVSTYQVTSPGKPGQRGFTDPFVYRVISGVPPETDQFLRDYIAWKQENPDALVDSRYRLRRFDYFTNVQLPREPVIEDIRTLTAEVAPGPSDAEKIRQIHRHLRENYVYTLQPDTPDGVDPMRAFLFDTQKGHCEFFATAMVLMLRTQNIPARMVNGFYTTEWNEGAGVFVVKQSDAHSWVEAWIDGVGWITVDPTPPASAGSGAYPDVELAGGIEFREVIRMWWQRNVIDYTASKQALLYQGIAETPVFRKLEAAGAAVLGRVASLTGGQVAPEGGSELLSLAVALVLFTAVALIFLWASFHLWKLARGRERRERPSIDYFNALIRKLEKLGIRREESQTPQELVAAARDRFAASDQLQWVIDLYYAERFSGHKAAPEERRSALRIIDELSLTPPRGSA